jgi:transcription termination/antitermination protein NusG
MFDVQGVFNDTKVKWYILQTYVGFEDAVRKNLELKIQNLSIEDKIQEIFIPTNNVVKINSKGEKTERPKKIYPGYIYLKCVLDKEVGYLIQNTPYVSRIAGTGDYAVALEDGYVEKLKEKLSMDDEAPKAANLASFKIGDLVRVVDGPFKEMQGKISGIDPSAGRLNVLLTIFERESNVELDVLEVEKVF